MSSSDKPDRLARICRALPDLATGLRAADLPLSPDRWQNLHDLLLALAERRRLPADPAALANLIAPLFCRSEREQRRFRQVFDAWIEARAPIETGRGEVKTQADPPRGPGVRWWLLGLVLLLAASVGGFYGYNRLFPPAAIEDQIAAARPPETPVAPPRARPKPCVEGAEDQPAVVPEPEQRFRSVPPRRWRPAAGLDSVHQSWFQTLGQLCLLLPAFFALAWLLLRWLSWQTVLERRQGGDQDPFVGIALDAGARLLMIGEPAVLMDPRGDALQVWTRALHPWPRRGLLSTRRPPPVWEQVLERAGFAVAEISSAGVQTLALRLGGLQVPAADSAPFADGQGTHPTPSLPRLLQDQGQWSQPVAPGRVEQQALLGSLDGYLGSDGAQLLAAMAVYPQLHWGLTRLLDLSLFPDGPVRA